MSPSVLCKAAWDLQKCMVPVMQLEGDEIVKASLLAPTDDLPGVPPTSEEEAVLLGDEPEPQQAQKVTMSPPECPGIPKPKEPTKPSDAPSPPAPSSMASNSCSDQSQNTRRAWHRAIPQHLPNPSPDSPNNWVCAYIEERTELPSCWWEFRPLHHKGTGSLSKFQVQKLARKQAVTFRLPAAKKEKSGCWSAPPSLASLRCKDFLPPSPIRIPDPRDV